MRRHFVRLTKLTVNGNGYFRTNELYVHAYDVEIDLAGDMHADFSGFNDEGSLENGTGLAKETYHQGGAGGGHGGRGGKSQEGYFSAYSYDSVYMPRYFGAAGGRGSDGSGGRGGGYMYFNVESMYQSFYKKPLSTIL